VFSKLLERQVYSKIFGIISPYITQWQHGFLPGRSTVSQLAQVVHQLPRALEMRQQVDVIYLDFSKAFDRVSHEKLLFKLECLGIKGPLLACFRSYLSGRRHRVVIDNEASDFLPVTSGVPQGSILGPLLFLVYINDMPDVISGDTSLPLCADDSKCFCLILGQDDGDKLQENLNKLLEWSCIWGMEFNVKKCKVVRVARTKCSYERDYFLGGTKLERVAVEKDLGIWISHDLSWNHHVEIITSRAQKMLNLLHRTCKDMTDIRTKKLLYITWVRTRLEYASAVWSPYTKRNITSLEQIQRRATRFILGKEYSKHDRLSKLNLLPLQYRREIHDLVFFFRCFKNMYSLDILDFVSFRTCNKPLRKIDYLTLNVPFSRTESFKNSYFIRVCRSWNELPLNIRKSNTLSVFHKKLFAYFYDKFSANFLS